MRCVAVQVDILSIETRHSHAARQLEMTGEMTGVLRSCPQKNCLYIEVSLYRGFSLREIDCTHSRSLKMLPES